MPSAASGRPEYLDASYDTFLRSIDGEAPEHERFAAWREAAEADDQYVYEPIREGASRPEVCAERRNGRPLRLINLSSYNYLGLGYHPEVIAAAKAALDRHGLGAASSPINGGTLRIHSELEHAILEFFGAPERGVSLFSSGYGVNTGTLGAVLGRAAFRHAVARRMAASPTRGPCSFPPRESGHRGRGTPAVRRPSPRTPPPTRALLPAGPGRATLPRVSDEAARPDGPTLPRCPHCGGDHPPHLLKCPDTDMPLPLEGRVLHGKFRFVRQLGKGGMAAVWAAINTLVERPVAIKLIRPEAGRDEETVARFRAEAKAAGRIGHPNVCEIFDFGIGPLGPYIVMERLRGKSLGQLIRDEERLDPSLAAGIVRQALAGLEAAHRRGIIHRDLKPENLFVHQPEVGSPVVKIMDFGVSKLTDGSSEVETEHGALLGTPEYMSPEQFKGASRADVRTDLWATGAILYKALTGKTAFGGPSVAGTLLMVTTDDPTPIPELVRGVPPELVEIVERCLRKDPEERFQSAQALIDALEPFDQDALAGVVVDGEPSREEPAPPTVSVGPRSTGHGEASQAGRAARERGDGDDPSENDAAPPDTLLPTTRRRVMEESRKPARPDRRAWLLIAGVTVIVASVLVALTRGPDQPGHDPVASARAPSTVIDDIPTTAEAEIDAGDRGSTSGGGIETQDSTEAGGDTTAAATTTSGEPTDVGTTGAPTGTTTDDDLVLGDEPTTGIPEGPDPDDDDDDGGGGRSIVDPAHPPPTPPGTIRVGRYLTLAKPGPSGTHAEARAYCKSLGKQSFVGVSSWTLAGPQTARKFAAHVKKGKYWTTALWKGKAAVLALPAKTSTSLDAEKKGPRPLCIAKWP
ncbi:protein kinase domain-containing protein [Paraliomyxa miuraensis]|uniref:protein kinase domain-containing protein n=1 Tax=Paraliomyxa miuraensis TaxID=376150 RepID=UPI002255E2DC|nr:protein kinase [Paraliomyxa miuraensis]MCX4242281.1 aminotransferase class I/II-fold pyridoxal phosphate-dependent enzyme [Paraliomyxa miuraensis]